MTAPEYCKDCEKVENIKEILKGHSEKIEASRRDIADIKAEDKETKLYVRMILEKIEDLTLGFEHLRQEKDQERLAKIKELELNKKSDEQLFKDFLVDSFRLVLKVLLVSLGLLGGIKAAVILDLIKLLQ